MTWRPRDPDKCCKSTLSERCSADLTAASSSSEPALQLKTQSCWQVHTLAVLRWPSKYLDLGKWLHLVYLGVMFSGGANYVAALSKADATP